MQTTGLRASTRLRCCRNNNNNNSPSSSAKHVTEFLDRVDRFRQQHETSRMRRLEHLHEVVKKLMDDEASYVSELFREIPTPPPSPPAAAAESTIEVDEGVIFIGDDPKEDA